MFGAVSQNAAPPPERLTLRERVFEQRTAGPYSFRYATPLGYSFFMWIMRNWRVTQPITIKSDAARHPLPSVLTVHATLENNDLKGADDWVRESQDAGYGVIALPSDSKPGEPPPTHKIARTRRAAVAQDLTSKDENWAVLSEPREGWVDVLRPMTLLAFPVFFAVGVVVTLVATEAIQ